MAILDFSKVMVKNSYMVPRLIEPALIAELDRPIITILVGPRQVGKSTIMHRMEKAARARGKKTVFYDLERPDHLKLFAGRDEDVLGTLEKDGSTIFLDEFQYIKDATRILKIVHDSRKAIKLVVSGSSSIEIHKHLKESLAGRFRLHLIGPLEWAGERDRASNASWRNYLRFGGMPGLLHEKNDAGRMELLSGLVSAYLLKDVRSLVQEENVRAFNSMLYILAQNQGSLVSVASLARDIRLSEPAIARYLDILEQTYAVFPLGSYSRNLANELKKSRKYYLFDHGIRNMLIKDFSPWNSRADGGIMAESLVHASLRKRLKANESLHFWRTKQGDEVDFILCRDRLPIPIEVKKYFHGEKDFRSLELFLRAYPESPRAYVLSLDGPAAGDPPLFHESTGRRIRVLHVREAQTFHFF
jgi:uncharacterized protein